MKQTTILLGLLFLLQSCEESKKTNALEKMQWLQGEWVHETEEGTAIERWVKRNDTVMDGFNFFIKGKDTLSKETVELLSRGEQLLYMPTVLGQNNNAAVTFTLISDSANKFVFENAEHDFPQRISYHHLHKDSLLAAISGKLGGEDRVILFPYKRSK